jgi:hypothetical protein
MSIVNAVANLLTPGYPTFFLVRTPMMENAEAHGGYFRGVSLVETDPDTEPLLMWDSSGLLNGLLGVCLSFVPLAVVGGMSPFRVGNSTSIQRGFTMSWLVIGIFMSWVSRDTRLGPEGVRNGALMFVLGRAVVGYFIMGIAATGGIVIVGKMVKEFGICTMMA